MEGLSKVSISGIGAVTCVGANANDLWQSSIKGSSGISQGIGPISEFQYDFLRKKLNLPESSSKSVILARTSINEAMDQAGWDKLNSDDGFILATTTGQIDLWENQLLKLTAEEPLTQDLAHFLKHQPLGALLDTLSSQLNFQGQNLLLSTACTAATQAIAMGRLWIEQGRVKRCLVGGVEILSKLTIEGFRSLQLLNSQAATPFDRDRLGINLAEGAGFLCLEKNPKKSLALLLGSGTTTDAYHMTSPHPEGRGSYGSMKMALKDANLLPQDIQWIHAHGTGSRANDDAEGHAIRQLFNLDPWVSSTKNIHGHTLGASGAIETVLCVLALQEETILKTAGLKNADVELRHPKENLKVSMKHILKNTLGFGGNNGSIILGKSL
jgi:3-oxoacyl-(acyl-carrier-protein) synthase